MHEPIHHSLRLTIIQKRAQLLATLTRGTNKCFCTKRILDAVKKSAENQLVAAQQDSHPADQGINKRAREHMSVYFIQSDLASFGNVSTARRSHGDSSASEPGEQLRNSSRKHQ